MNWLINRIHSFRHKGMIIAFLILTIVLSLNCTRKKDTQIDKSELKEIINPKIQERPNIVWIVAEDLSPVIPSFGDSTIVTPHLSKLAHEGVCYDNFYAPHPVCGPARAAIITGMYANSIGASHMRTGPWFGGNPTEKALTDYEKKAMPPQIKSYEAIPSKEVKMFTEYLRSAGYYCSNNSKEDYQFIKTTTAWDESGNKAHWRNRPKGTPFFSVFNIGLTHESQIWRKTKDSLWIKEDLKVPVPPYLPSSEIAKKDVRRMYSNIKEMDERVGAIVKQLQEDGLLENTIVFWYTDHGGPLPRQKRLLYDSGIKVPMIIRFPESLKQGSRDSRMISFIDLAPTLLSLAGIEIPDYIQGSAFLGKQMRSTEPSYVFGAADRFDETTDRVRSVRDKRYKYIKYYEPEKPMYLEVGYRNNMPIMQELLRLKKAGQLTAVQRLWFRESKPGEELFDLQNDPFELNNLANNKKYEKKLLELRLACNRWTTEINDTGLIPEQELIDKFWPDGKQPITKVPVIKTNENRITLKNLTEGASIGFKILKNDDSTEFVNWQIYTEPLSLKKGEKLEVIAHRIGFKPSKTIQFP